MTQEGHPSESPGEVLAHLREFLDDHAGQFALCIVAGWVQSLRRSLIDVFTAQAREAGHEVAVVDWQAAASDDPLEVLQSALARRPAPPSALLVYNLEREMGPGKTEGPGKGHSPLARFNSLREEFVRRHPIPWILWMTPAALKDLAERAPDFYDFHQVVFWVDEPVVPRGESGKFIEPARSESAPGVDLLSDQAVAAMGREIERLRARGSSRTPTESEQFLNVSFNLARHYLADHCPAQSLNILQDALHESERIASAPWQARVLGLLATAHSKLGHRTEAEAAARQSADRYRALAMDDPAAFLPDLAMSLNNLGAMLSALGRREEALAAAREAADSYRKLVEQNPAAFLPDLAGSLNNLGAMLSSLGQRKAALAASQEATDIRRKLAQQNPAAFLPDLSMSLNNLGNMLSALGQREEALAAAQEAADICRKLAQQNPAAFLPDLAKSLNNLGNRLSDLGQREAALAATREAADIYRKLAQQNPAAFLPDLAASLNNLGLRLSDLGQMDEARAALGEAFHMLLPFYEQHPDAFGPKLAIIYNNIQKKFPDMIAAGPDKGAGQAAGGTEPGAGAAGPDDGNPGPGM